MVQLSDQETLSFELGHPMILEVGPMNFWMIVYVGPSVVSKCIGLQITYVNGGLVMSYVLNLGLEQVFYLEPFRSTFRLALVRTHYEAITLEKINKLK